MTSPPDWYEDGLNHIWLPYTQMKTALRPSPVVRADGVRLTLADGRTLIDGIASWWTAAHGYNHQHIMDAIAAQAAKMPHVMFGGLVNEPALRLAKRLAALTPGDLNRCFFAESGSVSVEVAMKMAVQYWLNKGVRGRTKFVSFRGGYHGDTMATMSVCDPDEGMHGKFRDYLPGQIIADLPDGEAGAEALGELFARHRHEIAGVLSEPLVQGAGGMLFHDPETLATIRKLCDKHGLLLIADEIFTGFGRTGTMFACEQAGIVPDIMTLSKALTGGTMPLSCAIARDHIFNAFYDDDPDKALMHGPTYMGHALACAAANASLDLFDREPRLEQVKRISDQMSAELETCLNLPGVRDVRVKGAIGVVELTDKPNTEALRAFFIDQGCWIRPLGRVIYLTPPLVIAEQDLRQLTSAISKAISRKVYSSAIS